MTWNISRQKSKMHAPPPASSSSHHYFFFFFIRIFILDEHEPFLLFLSSYNTIATLTATTVMAPLERAIPPSSSHFPCAGSVIWLPICHFCIKTWWRRYSEYSASGELPMPLRMRRKTFLQGGTSGRATTILPMKHLPWRHRCSSSRVIILEW